MSENKNQNLITKINNARSDAYNDLSDKVMELCGEHGIPEQDSVVILQAVFSNFELDNNYDNSILSTTVTIKPPKMEYWDEAKTKPKFEIEVYDMEGSNVHGNLHSLTRLNQAGQLDGLSEVWHENGQKEEELNFKNGQRHGLNVWWHDNGQKESEWNYKDGEKHGVCKNYGKDGNMTKTERWEDGWLVEENGYKVDDNPNIADDNPNKFITELTEVLKKAQNEAMKLNVLYTDKSKKLHKCDIGEAANSNGRFWFEGTIRDLNDKTLVLYDDLTGVAETIKLSSVTFVSECVYIEPEYNTMFDSERLEQQSEMGENPDEIQP